MDKEKYAGSSSQRAKDVQRMIDEQKAARLEVTKEKFSKLQALVLMDNIEFDVEVGSDQVCKITDDLGNTYIVRLIQIGEVLNSY